MLFVVRQLKEIITCRSKTPHSVRGENGVGVKVERCSVEPGKLHATTPQKEQQTVMPNVVRYLKNYLQAAPTELKNRSIVACYKQATPTEFAFAKSCKRF